MDKEDVELVREFLMMEKAAAKSIEEIRRDRDRELGLLDAFKKKPSPETFQPLYRSFQPLIYKATYGNMRGSPLPEAAHHMLAAQSFLDAIRTFKPGSAPFHIHMVNTVKNKGKRLNYTYQNIGYIPEARATKYQTFVNTTNWLKEQLGREPSTQEMADELAWSPKMVETMRKEIRKDLVMDEVKAEINQHVDSDQAQQMLHDIHPTLIPAHQVVLEYAQGWNGRPKLNKPTGGADLPAISKASGLSVPQIRSALKTITRRVKHYRRNVGAVTDAVEETPDELE